MTTSFPGFYLGNPILLTNLPSQFPLWFITWNIHCMAWRFDPSTVFLIVFLLAFEKNLARVEMSGHSEVFFCSNIIMNTFCICSTQQKCFSDTCRLREAFYCFNCWVWKGYQQWQNPAIDCCVIPYHKSWLSKKWRFDSLVDIGASINVFLCFFSAGLQATLLIRHPETKQLLVNFDPLLYQVMRESECMRKHDLEIPEAAHIICLGQEQLKENYNTLKVNYIYYHHITPKQILVIWLEDCRSRDSKYKYYCTLTTSLTVHFLFHPISTIAIGV